MLKKVWARLKVSPLTPLSRLVVAERWHGKALDEIEIEQGPAPLMGEHTTEIMRQWLGLDEQRISDLIEQGVLEPLDRAILEAAQMHIAGSEAA
jgi:hypothetical protein